MQHLRTEICEFGCFVEGNLPYLPGRVHDPRIGRHHTVNISPDLDFLNVECCAGNCSRVVRATAPERRYRARECRSDVSTHNHSPSGIEVRSRGLLQALCCDIHERGSLSKTLVGHNALPRIDMRCLESKAVH